MTKIRRYFKAGNLYFLTHVTYQRTPILVDHADLLQCAIEKVRTETPFEIIAWAILPDHFHLIVDPLEGDLSTQMKLVKLKFSAAYRSRMSLKSGRLWQFRFWDHCIRSEEELAVYTDYIHYNPVKHGLVSKAQEYQHSSLNEFVNRGVYGLDWGAIDNRAGSELSVGE